MIQMLFMMMRLSKLDELLERLEENSHLSPREDQALLELAWKVWGGNTSVHAYLKSKPLKPIYFRRLFFNKVTQIVALNFPNLVDFETQMTIL
jgi:hypothetical protein